MVPVRADQKRVPNKNVHDLLGMDLLELKLKLLKLTKFLLLL